MAAGGVPVRSALVLGAGLAGLGAAAALRRHVPDVVLLEKDPSPHDAASRPGVPQSRQLHNVLGRAQVAWESLAPGFCSSLVAAGGTAGQVSRDTYVYEIGARMPQRDLGFQLMSAPRMLVEQVARELLDSDESLDVRQGTRATGLVTEDGVVTGARATSDANEDLVFEADLVVDAMGAVTPGPRWLASAGVAAPVDEMPVDQWYVSVQCARPPADHRFYLVFPTPPRSRGGLLSPAGGDRWVLSLSGRTADPPPRSWDDMRAMAGELEDDAIAQCVMDAIPLSEPTLYRRPSSLWRRYDRLQPALAGYLPIGDALAVVNPLGGQGISVAAWEAALLDEVLQAAAERSEGIRTLTERYLRVTASAVAAAWHLGEWMVDPSGDGDPQHARTAMDAIADRVVADADFHRYYARVWHLLEPLTPLQDFVTSVLSKAEAPNAD